MPKRRRGGELGEVILAGGNEMPVGAVEERPEDVVAAHPEGVGRRRRADPDCQDEEHQEERGQQPPGAPEPERNQIDPAGSGVLGQQQTRDEIARKDEEHVHAQEAAADPAVAEVVSDDGHDSHRSDAVEGGAISERGVPRGRRAGGGIAGLAHSRAPRGYRPGAMSRAISAIVSSSGVVGTKPIRLRSLLTSGTRRRMSSKPLPYADS